MKRILPMLALSLCLLMPALASATKLPDGFIALTDREMPWADAKAWCESQGGRLPLVGGLARWDGKNPPAKGISIDGFGVAGDASWPPPGVRDDTYWTGTERFDDSSWVVEGGDTRDTRDKISVSSTRKSNDRGVICVPK